MKVRRLSYAMGAEVTGIDARERLSAEEIKAVLSAWLEHQVLVFPDQAISMAQQVAFTRQFGEIELHPLMHARHREHPEIFEITNRIIDGKRSETANIARRWHTDGAFTLSPTLATFLHCRACPELGGATWFANAYMAYDALSSGMKQLIENLEVVNDVRGADLLTRNRDADKVAQEIESNPPVIQPLVRTHDQTGRKALYVNETNTVGILGMTREESRPLLDFLFRHSVRPEYIYRHEWKVNDIVLWDNRCTLHMAPKDYEDDQIRHMCRTSLKGPRTGRLLSSEERQLA